MTSLLPIGCEDKEMKILGFEAVERKFSDLKLHFPNAKLMDTLSISKIKDS